MSHLLNDSAEQMAEGRDVTKKDDKDSNVT